MAVIAAVAFAVTASQAQTKIALIDLRSVFDKYYKTKEADVKLKERGQDILKVRQGMAEDYKKTQEEYNKLMEGAKDPSISSEERDKRKRSAEAKLEEIREIETNVRKYDQQAQEQFAQQNLRMREKILQEIKEVVEARAKADSYSMVIDVAAETVNRTPVLLYNNGQYDITNDVLKKLNENAPPPSLAKPEEPVKDSKTPAPIGDKAKPAEKTKPK